MTVLHSIFTSVELVYNVGFPADVSVGQELVGGFVLQAQKVKSRAVASQGERTPMEPRIVIEGGKSLQGTIPISGSKNAALAVLAGTVLASDGITVVRNLPRIHDIEVMACILRELGCTVTFEDDGKTARIDASQLDSWQVPDSLASKMRASLHLLGPLVARLGRAQIPQPGGCSIGARPIDLHLKGLTAMSADVDTSIFAEAPADGLRGAQIFLDKPSVGATMNLMMAAALAHGETVIENAAQEPDIEDLANLINAMGVILKARVPVC